MTADCAAIRARAFTATTATGVNPMTEMRCERCQQPIALGEFYYQIFRSTNPYTADPKLWPTVADLHLVVHVDCKKGPR